VTVGHEQVAATILDAIGSAAPVLGAALGPEGVAAAALVSSLAHAAAEALRRKGGELTLEHLRMPPREIRDWKVP
jgi:hypothetical protein